MRRRSRLPAPESSGRVETLTLGELAFGGEALARLDGQVVFVPFGLPGEQVTAELTEDKRDFAHARILDVEGPSAERVAPPCPYFLECGGCSLQHAAYPAQLRFKQSVVAEQLRRIGHFADTAELVLPTIGMISPWEYRNHIRYTVGRRFGELCFTKRGGRQLLRIDRCLIAQPPINALTEQLQGTLVGFKAHQVAIRVGANTGEVLVNPRVDVLPEGTSGQEYLEEALFDRQFRIASPAFFQVNTRREPRPIPDGLRQPPWPVPPDGLSMAEILAIVVHDRLELTGDELLVDAYGGVGTFAVLLARSAARVIGIEESPAAVKDARHNAADLPNVELLEGKTEHVLPTLPDRPDAVVLDPARVGCEPAVLDALVAIEVPRVVYVSCDPATLARDLAILVERGFRLHHVQPLDMFPQTYHIECVALLTR